MTTRPTYVYVASSWRNSMQPAVVAALHAAGIDSYDFRNPGPDDTGFSWREVMPDAGVECEVCGQIGPDHDLTCAVGAERRPSIPGKGSDWEPVGRYIEMVNHPRALDGFSKDFEAMVRADTFVMVLPCGKSAHLELGWAVGAGKRTAILLEDPVEPELMYRMVDFLTPSLVDLLGWLGVED